MEENFEEDSPTNSHTKKQEKEKKVSKLKLNEFFYKKIKYLLILKQLEKRIVN